MSNPEFLLIKEDKEDSSHNFQIVKRIQSEEFETLSSSFNSQYSQDRKKEINSHQEIEECHDQICRITSTTTPLPPGEKHKVEEKEEEENDDGFKTPTSLYHKISVDTKCPPAPRKTKPSLKRKASSQYSNHCNFRHPLDLSEEVLQLLFPTQHINPLSDSQQTTKKVRREQHK
ncbi:hypothetical protein RJT34_15896 [Clitoria ternatea]|uniref:Uncharacterized protein n=1 Tax=Clitoria ternatea TaxID=43366 RepID=A0AAN9J688_CLITE